MDLNKILNGTYEGVLVSSQTEGLENIEVKINQLSDSLIKLTFSYQDSTVVFRAFLDEKTEGVLMVVQERTTEKYILNGIDGFMYKRNNVHGGFLSNLDSFYFHLKLNQFDGIKHELYFLGKLLRKEVLIGQTQTELEKA